MSAVCEADHREFVIYSWVLLRLLPEYGGALSYHISKHDRVQRGEPEGASLAELQEHSGDVFHWHVRVENKRVLTWLRWDPTLGDRTQQLSHRHWGTPDVDDARKECHRVESGQRLGALLG